MKFLLLLLPALALALSDSDRVITPELVSKINSVGAKWKASTEQNSFLDNATIAQFKGILGALKGPRTLPRKTFARHAVPDSFDSSQHWASCPTIMNILDQSACGSCWAMAAVGAISDRYCTQGVKTNISVSAAHLMSCCSSCGMGCNGGYPDAAWSYWVNTGLPTEQCQPYPFPRCEHHIPAGKYPACPSNEYPTPACYKTCKDSSTYSANKGKKAYSLNGESDLQQEIMANGPIEVAFTVYADFPTYKSGVYHHVSGSALGGHAVKMIGWGVTTDGTKYWIINNSWNEDWGNHGQFWILRGNNECGIEDEGSAGDAK